MTITKARPVPFFSPGTPLSDINEMADAALERALRYTAGQMDFSDVEFAVGHIRQGDPAACGHFQYGLAREAAAYLHAYDRTIRAVYLFDCDATAEDVIFDLQPQNSLVHLLVRTERKSGALTALVLSFDRALAACAGRRFGLPEVSYMLDVQLVDEEEVQARTGYGALLASIYLRPNLVWQG